MKAIRIYPDENGDLCFKDDLSYGKSARDGHWYFNHPGDYLGLLSNHKVEEHEDGTITVSPSILIKNHNGTIHGYLIKGEWSDC